MKHVISAMLFLVLVLPLAACGSREAISSTEFTTRMTEAGHTVVDQSHYFEDDPDTGVTTYLIADNGSFDVEFLVFGTAERAREVHTSIRNEIESTGGSSAAHREVNTSNFNRFRQTSDGEFGVVSRIGNTLVAVVTSSDNQAEVDAVLDILGY